MAGIDKEFKEKLTGLTGSLEKMQRLTNSALDNIPEEMKPDLTELRAELNDTMRKMKSGDADGLNALLKKYAK